MGLINNIVKYAVVGVWLTNKKKPARIPTRARFELSGEMRWIQFSGSIAALALVGGARCELLTKKEALESSWHLPLLGLPLSHSSFFHTPASPQATQLFYSLSELGILSATVPENGTIKWRLPTDQTVMKLGSNAIFTAGNATLKAFNALLGFNLWDMQLDGIVDYQVLPVDSLSASEDVVVLQKSNVLTRLSGSSGQVLWEQQIAKGKACQLSRSGNQVYVVATAPSGQSYVLYVNIIDALSGEHQQSINLDGHIDSEDALLTAKSFGMPVAIWMYRKSMKANLLGTKAVETLSKEVTQDVKVVAPQTTSGFSSFLLQSADGSAETYEINTERHRIQSLAKTVNTKPGQWVLSQLENESFFVKLTKDSVEVYRNDLTTPLHSLPHDLGEVTYFSVGLEKSGNTINLHTLFFMKEGGEVGIWSESGTLWQRDEALSTIQEAVFLELENPKVMLEYSTGFLSRLSRHFKQLLSLFGKFGSKSTKKDDSTQTDLFGFKKYLICLSLLGKIFALDTSANGAVVWSHSIPGPVNDKSRLFNVKDKILLYTQGSLLVLNGQTGQIHSQQPMGSDMIGLAGNLAVIEDNSKVSLMPLDKRTPLTDEHVFTSLRRGNTIQGYAVDSATKEFHSTWKIEPAGILKEFTIADSEEPIASIGKVLTNRAVLYKYLNNHLAATASVTDKGVMYIYVFDAVSGKIEYETIQRQVDQSAPVFLSINENWLICTFKSTSIAKGWHIMNFEFYESQMPNERWLAANGSSFDSPNMPYVRSQSFILPGEVGAIATTITRFGISSKDLLVALDSYSIMSVSRRELDPGRPLGREASASEREQGLFRYTPFIGDNRRNMLTRDKAVFGIKKIITTPALTESTSCVFAYGVDLFYGRTAPSGTYDVLGNHFNKLQLVLTIIALGIATRVMGPIIQLRQLKTRWNA